MYNILSKVLSIFARNVVLADDLNLGEQWGWVGNVVDAINTLLYPLLVVVGAAGMIYAIVLGVNMARADSAEKREEAKKKLINVIVGLAIMIGLILFFKLFISVILPAFLKPDGSTATTEFIGL